MAQKMYESETPGQIDQTVENFKTNRTGLNQTIQSEQHSCMDNCKDNIFYSLDIFGVLKAHNPVDSTHIQDLGKIVIGVVDNVLIDKQFKSLFVAFNKGYLSKYNLKTFEIEHTWGKIHSATISQILITGDDKH